MGMDSETLRLQRSCSRQVVGQPDKCLTVAISLVSSMHADVKASGWHVDCRRYSFFAKPGALFNEVKTSASATGAVVFAPGTNTTPNTADPIGSWVSALVMISPRPVGRGASRMGARQQTGRRQHRQGPILSWRPGR